MKHYYFIVVTCLLSIGTFAQSNPDDKDEEDRVLPKDAFNRMVIQDITYAIAGENAPTSGVKVDVSKPEGTITGVFPLKDFSWLDLVGFELKGGVTDKNFSFLKGYTNANSAFEFKSTFTYIPLRSSARYDDSEKVTIRSYNAKVDQDAEKLLDTIYVIDRLYQHHLKTLKEDEEEAVVDVTKDERRREIAAYFIPIVMAKPNMVIKPKLSWKEMLDLLPQVTKVTGNTYAQETFYRKLISLYKKYQKLAVTLPDTRLDMKIENAKEVWTKKKYFWLTLSPYVRTEKVNEFYTTYKGVDSLYFKPGYRWYFGASFSCNWYVLKPQKWAALFRITGLAARNNNLSNLTAYEYETRIPFYQNETSATDKLKRGLAYNNSDINLGFDKQVSGEVYLLPLSKPIPGLYLSGYFGHSRLYRLPSVVGRANDEIRVGGEGGLVFNVNNRDKDKTLLSILTYFRYEDFTDRQRTPIATGIREPRQDFLERNISMGIRVGIPIYLPKRS